MKSWSALSFPLTGKDGEITRARPGGRRLVPMPSSEPQSSLLWVVSMPGLGGHLRALCPTSVLPGPEYCLSCLIVYGHTGTFIPFLLYCSAASRRTGMPSGLLTLPVPGAVLGT